MGEAIGGGFDKVLLYHDRESFRVNATNLINLERPPYWKPLKSYTFF